MTARRVSRNPGRLIGLVSLLAWCAGFALPAGQARQPGNPWKQPPERSILATGLPCIYQRDTASPTTVVGLFIYGGKSDVPPGLDGLATLATRLALEIPDAGKVQDLMAQAIRMSLACLEDCSIILIECLSENLEEAIRVAAEIIQDPLITSLRVGRAKENMRIYGGVEADDSAISAHNAVLAALFPGKGYGTALYGNEESLKAIGRKELLSFERRHLNRQNVFFCVETDLEKAPVLELLEKSFAGFPDGETVEVPRDTPVLPPDREVRLNKEIQQTYIGRSYVLPPPDPAAYAKGCLVETLLGKGPGSRLWELRVGEKLAYGVDVELIWTRTAGILTAYLETGKAKSAAASKALDRILSALHENGISEEELATARTMAKARFLRSAEMKAPRLRMLGLFEVLGLGLDRFTGISGTIDALTREEVNAFLREILAPDRALRIIVGPGPDEPKAR